MMPKFEYVPPLLNVAPPGGTAIDRGRTSSTERRAPSLGCPIA